MVYKRTKPLINILINDFCLTVGLRIVSSRKL